MQHESRHTARLAATVAVAVLLCLAGAVFAQSGHVSVQGHITTITGLGAQQYQVTLDNGGTYTVPRSLLLDRNLHVGDLVRFDGSASGGVMTVENTVLISNPLATGAIGTANTLSAIVQSVNRDLNYVTVRDQATGQNLKIDLRRMDAGRSVDVWQLRAGDRIVVSGRWESSDTFEADRVNFPTHQPMSVGSANALSGIVQSLNRRLNFVMVRDQVTGRDVKIDVRRMDTRQSVNVWQLRAGDPVVVSGGWTNRDTFRANRVNFSTYQPMTSGNGSANVVTGTVQNVNRDLNYVTIRNDANGQMVKIDVRQMETRQSVNVWQLRAGDRIVVSGGWEKGDTFRARSVNF